MAKFQITSKAVDDLTKIWEYTYQNWSESQADKYYKLLTDSFQEISENPKLGKSYFEIKETLKGFKTGRHIVFYQETSTNSILIIRILHESMDLKNRINK